MQRHLPILIALCVLTATAGLASSGAPSPDFEKATAFAYYPGLRRLEVRVKDAASTTLSVWRPGEDRALVQRTFEATGPENVCLIDLPAMEDGTYELRIVRDNDPAKIVRRSFKHKNFVWLGNALGKDDTIYPPFEPIRVEGRNAKVVLRTCRMNGFGLWDSVESEGKEILASPIVLRAQTEAGEQQWQFDDGRWTTVQPHLAVFESRATAPAVQVRTRSSLEYDGCMRVELDLLPGKAGQAVQRLWLEIPLQDKEASLFHYAAFECMRRNYAGKTPRGGKVV